MDNTCDNSFLFNSFNDDSLLEALPLTKNLINKRDVDKRIVEDAIEEEQSKAIAKHDTVELIELSDEDDDCLKNVDNVDIDSVIDVDSNSCSEFSNLNEDERIVDDNKKTLLKEADDDEIEIIPVEPALTSSNHVSSPAKLICDDSIDEMNDSLAVSTFTSIKTFKASSTTTLLQDYFDNLNDASTQFSILKSQSSCTSNLNEDDWIELSDDDQPLNCLISPIKSTFTKSKAKTKRTLIKSAKKTLTKTKEKTFSTKQQRNKINEKLFDDINIDPSKPKSVLKIQKKDIINYITVCIDSSVFELAEDEIKTLFNEKKLKYEVIEGSDNCVIWKCHSELETMYNQMNSEERNTFNCLSVGRNSLLDHFVFVCKASNLNQHLQNYVQPSSKDDTMSLNPFLGIDSQCKLYNAKGVTLVIFKLESYLRSIRNKINNTFRKRLNQLMSETDSTSSQSTKQRKQKDSNEDLEITAEHVEMFLIDLKMKFVHLFENSGFCPTKLTILNVENEQELAQTLYRYSRSLSEQLYRFERVRENVEFFAHSDKQMTVDPVDDESYRLLWIRQLQQFPNVTATAVEAIVNRFPSPLTLMSALKQTPEPIKMLAEIGDTGKRVGNELASKLYLFMTNKDPNIILKTTA